MIDLGTIRRPLVALLALASLAPTLAFGQGARAGVVTTLQGTVVAARGGLPQPVPLKFRDDVFLDDRITTGDQSLARLLLGGKAVVTIRERSSLTVTEVPGRATISLDSGKIAVAVARERMRPGETLEVRTPNAVAGVRGTVFIVDVSQATAQGTPPASGPVTTQVVTLRGSVSVQFLGPAGTLGASMVVGADEFAAQTGTSGVPRSGTLTAEQRTAALAGLQASIRATGAANSDHIKEQLTQVTAAALGALLGDASAPLVPLRTLSDSNTNTRYNTRTVITACTTDPTVCQPQPGPSASSTGKGDKGGKGGTGGTGGTGIPGTVLINDLSGQLRPHDPLLPTPNPNPFVTSVGTPAIMILPAGLPAPTVVAADDLFAITRGSTPVITLLERPLLLAESDLTVSSGTVLRVDDILAFLTTSPLISVNFAALEVTPCDRCPGGGVALVSGAGRSLSLSGTLLRANTATLTTGGDLISIRGGATLVASLASPSTALVQSDHTDYNVGHGGIALADFFRVEGTGSTAGTVPSSAVLTGTLLASTQDTFTVTGAMLATSSGSSGSIVSFTSTTTSPLMSFDGSRLTLGAAGTGNLVEVNPFTSMTLNGPIATVTAPSQGWVMDRLVSSFGSEGLTTSGNTGPLVSFDGATDTPHAVRVAMFDLGGVNTTFTDCDHDHDAPASVRLGTDEPLRHGGTLYQGTGGATMTTPHVLKLDTALMAAMAPLVSLAGAGTALTSASDAFILTQQAKLAASIPADALVKLNTGATFTVTSGSLVNVAGGSFASLNVGSLVSLAGGSTMSILNGFLAAVSGNGSFALTGALVSFSGSNNTLVVNNSYAPTGFISGVPVYSSLGGTTGFNITRTNANLFTGLNSDNNVIKINGNVLPLNATAATGSLLAITGGTTSKIKVQ